MINFKSKQKRDLWINSLIGLIPEIIISIAAALILNDGIGVAFLVFVGLHILYFLIWLKKTIWLWIHFAWRGRKITTQTCIDHLRKNNYPEPDEYLDCGLTYLQEVISSTKADESTKVAAGQILGELSAMQLFPLGMSVRVQTQLALEDALQEYKRSYKKPIKKKSKA